jgi:hypothetical protein
MVLELDEALFRDFPMSTFKSNFSKDGERLQDFIEATENNSPTNGCKTLE